MSYFGVTITCRILSNICIDEAEKIEDNRPFEEKMIKRYKRAGKLLAVVLKKINIHHL